ncbi:two-component system regulatory protein YycI [Bacillus carboniphilus]|uniref:Two-component system regulatory protein YycI n=1 Tax=Bacillus carboniphilus TaxID=86663 RepID=A0ABY9JR32_9BACI|nr:two-component system regulatory protein YycI [Bacillus carboniphilus]WLR41859.1 two-component system regulatory protein YycI [Bacillus carboniphilus]
MNWSRAKTLFILVFLVLNAFLIMQYYEKKENPPTLTEQTFKSELETNDIEIVYDEIPEETKAHLMTLEMVEFSEEDKSVNKNQNLNKNIEMSQSNTYQEAKSLENPFSFKEKTMETELTTYVNEQLAEGQKFEYWGKSEDGKEVYFVQVLENKLVFPNFNDGVASDPGRITLRVKDNQVTDYERSILGEIKSETEVDIFSAEQALRVVFQKIEEGSKINEIELGYYIQGK